MVIIIEKDAYSSTSADYVYSTCSSMSRAVKKAVEAARQRRDTEVNVSDEGVSSIEDLPELCKLSEGLIGWLLSLSPLSLSLSVSVSLCLSRCISFCYKACAKP